MEFPPAYASLIFPMVITCYFAANSFFFFFFSSDAQFIKDYFHAVAGISNISCFPVIPPRLGGGQNVFPKGK